jgi:hypothetical protein
MPREKYHDSYLGEEQCRAAGAFGLIDRSDLTTKKHPGPGTSAGYRKPPGWQEIRDKGGRPHNAHLQGNVFGGDGRDLRNLIPLHEKVNTPYLRSGIEKEIRMAIEANNHVAFSIVPRYGNANTGIPDEVVYTYWIVETEVMRHCIVENSPSPRTHGFAGCPRRLN